MTLTYLTSICFFLTAYWAYKKRRKLKQREANAYITQANISHKEVRDGKYGAYRYYLHYAFPEGAGEAEVSARIYEMYQPGDVLDIMVQQGNPEISYLRHIFLDRVANYQILLVLCLVSGVGIPFLF